MTDNLMNDKPEYSFHVEIQWLLSIHSHSWKFLEIHWEFFCKQLSDANEQFVTVDFFPIIENIEHIKLRQIYFSYFRDIKKQRN